MNTPRDLAVPLDRLTWRDGQTLTSSDLSDDQHATDRFRHLHIRYLHKTWGVVEGLSVSKAGPSTVTVHLGYALDVAGRELLLPAAAEVVAPNIAAATTTYLVISQTSPAATGSCGTPDLSSLCQGEKTIVGIEEGQLSWKTASQVRIGYDVLLARVAIQNGKMASALDTSVQRRASTMAVPRIWSDVTVSGQTGWIDGTAKSPTEVQASVDTSNAGFIDTPMYFAYLTGTSQVASSFISSASASSFTFVALPVFAWNPGSDLNAAKAESEGWTITWLAIEKDPVP